MDFSGIFKVAKNLGGTYFIMKLYTTFKCNFISVLSFLIVINIYSHLSVHACIIDFLCVVLCIGDKPESTRVP